MSMQTATRVTDSVPLPSGTRNQSYAKSYRNISTREDVELERYFETNRQIGVTPGTRGWLKLIYSKLSSLGEETRAGEEDLDLEAVNL